MALPPLSARQKAALTAVLIRGTLEEAVLESGLSERTLRRLLADPGFRAHLLDTLAVDLEARIERMLAE